MLLFFSFKRVFSGLNNMFISHKTSSVICINLSTMFLHPLTVSSYQCFFSLNDQLLSYCSTNSSELWDGNVAEWKTCPVLAMVFVCFLFFLAWFPFTSLPFSKKQNQTACLMSGFYSLHVALKVTAIQRCMLFLNHRWANVNEVFHDPFSSVVSLTF